MVSNRRRLMTTFGSWRLGWKNTMILQCVGSGLTTDLTRLDRSGVDHCPAKARVGFVTKATGGTESSTEFVANVQNSAKKVEVRRADLLDE